MPGARPHRIGLIGAGWAGERHVRSILAVPGRARLAAVADIDTGRLHSLAEAWGVQPTFTDYAPMLGETELDGVVICTPHRLHAPAALAAFEAGLHVLVEKPLASTLSQADAMISAAQKAGRILMVAENVRYDPVVLKAAALIEEGALGEVFLVRITREHHMHAYLEARPWFLREPDAGIMMSGGVHDFEILRMLVGEVASVYAVRAPKMHFHMRADDTSLALVEHACGIRSVLQESFSTRTPHPGVSGVVYGRDGTLRIEPGKFELYRALEDGRPEQVETIAVEPADTFQRIMGHYLDCLDGTVDEPLTSGLEERKPLAAVMAAYRSMETGLPVRLDEIEAA